MDRGANIKDRSGAEVDPRRHGSGNEAEREMILGRGPSEGEKGETAPRVIISDTPFKSHRFIAKSRSQLTELDNLLRGIMNRPMKLK